jgi:hypothetical protein
MPSQGATHQLPAGIPPTTGQVAHHGEIAHEENRQKPSQGGGEEREEDEGSLLRTVLFSAQDPHESGGAPLPQGEEDRSPHRGPVKHHAPESEEELDGSRSGEDPHVEELPIQARNSRSGLGNAIGKKNEEADEDQSAQYQQVPVGQKKTGKRHG